MAESDAAALNAWQRIVALKSEFDDKKRIAPGGLSIFPRLVHWFSRSMQADMPTSFNWQIE